MKITQLTRLIKQKNISQTELARYLGVSRSAISKWKERNVIPLEKIPKLVKLQELPEGSSLQQLMRPKKSLFS